MQKPDFFLPGPEPAVNVPVNMLLFVMLELAQAKENLLMSALFRLFWRRFELFYYAVILHCRGYRNEL